ncbi:GNAT family N-acetyltransferase [Clostridium sp. LIBA-8841]|uniref:GNAT family N-acetyltransferase n=1 Tax=Clostridium sp. LIBA-8841 TaxID=2987530 RepID=UPI002AC53F74|nr:GNAT family N-acetyltransferase [Clostridium sp. LIBA-8841]MDZ5254027.1 GNAT family N-acetyltransferase [Clostridium sp. LIBA-8841]
MEIREANRADLEEIIVIEGECFPVAEAAKEKDIRKRFDAFKENFIVAVKDGKVIGFINGCTTDKPELPDELYHDTKLHNPNGDYQTVFGLDVLLEFRKNGVAEKLLNRLIELSKERGKKGMVLTCKDHLVHYYEKFGFKNHGVSDSSHGGAKWNDMILLFD